MRKFITSANAINVVVVLLLLLVAVSFSSFKKQEKVKVGFLVHDLVSERWKMDMDYFVDRIEELGGEAIAKNAFGDPHAQVRQGKALIDEGVKILAVVAEDGKILAELVDYANKNGAKIIAYDRMILNCDLHYYISFDSEKVGEMMADYALKAKPKGNYVIINGPSSDNNALLVKKGQMKILQPHIDSGKVKVVLDKESEAWYSLNALIIMDEFLMEYTGEIDVVLAASDGLSVGAVDALLNANKKGIVVTGQDASADACKQIVMGNQSMTIYKSIRKISSEAADLAMKLAKGEVVNTDRTISNGRKEVPSILFDPIVVDKTNLYQTVVADGHVKASDL